MLLLYSKCHMVSSRLQEDPPAGVSGAPTDNNIMLWNAVIFGCVHWEYTIAFLMFSFLLLWYLNSPFIALTLLVWQQEWHLACKNPALDLLGDEHDAANSGRVGQLNQNKVVVLLSEYFTASRIQMQLKEF